MKEVQQFDGAYVFFVDDNIAANAERAKKLFRALAPLNIRWVGQFSALAGRDPELLSLAAESGCMNAFIGIESISMDNLSSVHKEFSLSRDLAQTFGAFRDVGIDPHVSLVFGFDGDTPETIERTFDEMVRQRVHLLYAFLLTPLPGTELHARMAQEGRIQHENYSLYDTSHVVFRPLKMAPGELEDAYWDAYARFYSNGSILRRYSDAPRWIGSGRFRPCLHNMVGNLYFRKLIRQRLHPLVGGITARDHAQ